MFWRRKFRVAPLSMIAPYLALMLFCGFIPLLVAIREVANPSWINLKGSYSTIFRILKDFRVVPDLWHSLFLLVVFVPFTIIAVLALSLLLDSTRVRGNTFMRLVFLLPGIVAGGISVLIWMFFLGVHISWNPGNVQWLIAGVAFSSGAGSWIVIQYGSLRSIPYEVLEAAQVDGCNRLQMALRIKLPMISRYIGYMAILLTAGAIQIYSEPALLTSVGLTSNWWSLNQVAYSYAFQTADFAAGTALSLDMLLPSIIIGIIFVMRTDFLNREAYRCGR
jgi:multiple sugar transport system permease protein